jgi:hypothetical protein
MSPKKKTSGRYKKNRKRTIARKRTAKSKLKLGLKSKEGSLRARGALVASDDPIGACQYYDNSGQFQCVDNITKSECAKFKNSVFFVGEKCE